MSLAVLLLFLSLPFVASHWGVDSRQTDDPRVTTEVAVMAARTTIGRNRDAS
jgi:hypothetical protein